MGTLLTMTKGALRSILCCFLVLLFPIMVLSACKQPAKLSENESSSTSALPAIFVYATIIQDDTDSVTIKWVVENRSEETITFNANNLAIVQQSLTDEFCVSTDECSLPPDESSEVQIVLDNLDRSIKQQISITAQCTEGTSATYRFYIPIVDDAETS